jgi:hypothetical protein
MRFVLAVVWVLIGCAINGGLYWIFLNTPESTVWTLGASALLALIITVLDGLTVTGAMTILANGLSRAGVMRAVRAIPSIIPASIVVLLIWWLTIRAESWVVMREGQISASFIARFGWADVTWMFRLVHYAGQWFRWVVALMLALSLIAGFVSVGAGALLQFAWLRRALHPRSLLVSSLYVIVLIALPWKYLVPWRPAGLPATSIEIVFIAAKLSVAAILFAVAVVLMIREASGAPTPPRNPKQAELAA